MGRSESEWKDMDFHINTLKQTGTVNHWRLDTNQHFVVSSTSVRSERSCWPKVSPDPQTEDRPPSPPFLPRSLWGRTAGQHWTPDGRQRKWVFTEPFLSTWNESVFQLLPPHQRSGGWTCCSDRIHLVCRTGRIWNIRNKNCSCLSFNSEDGTVLKSIFSGRVTLLMGIFQ